MDRTGDPVKVASFNEAFMADIPDYIHGRHILEIVGVAAAYNMVSRVLVALDVRAETE